MEVFLQCEAFVIFTAAAQKNKNKKGAELKCQAYFYAEQLKLLQVRKMWKQKVLPLWMYVLVITSKIIPR